MNAGTRRNPRPRDEVAAQRRHAIEQHVARDPAQWLVDGLDMLYEAADIINLVGQQHIEAATLNAALSRREQHELHRKALACRDFLDWFARTLERAP